MTQHFNMHLFATSAISVVAYVIVSKKWICGAGMKLTVR